jgi:hypothetical protein
VDEVRLRRRGERIRHGRLARLLEAAGQRRLRAVDGARQEVRRFF